jgi:hypothetical protein
LISGLLEKNDGTSYSASKRSIQLSYEGEIKISSEIFIFGNLRSKLHEN